MISVYITSYNKGAYLPEAITSVLEQSLSPIEIIIIDDCSSDDSREIIQGFETRYPNIINTIFNERNLGISKTRNRALKMCKGTLITYLDADDIFYRNKLQTEYDCLLDNKNTDIVYSNFNYIDSKSNPIGVFSTPGDQPSVGNIFKETYNRAYNISSGNNYIYEMCSKSLFINAGMYDENIHLWEDWDLRIRMSKKYNYSYCSVINSAYRKLDTGLHASSKDSHYREQLKIHIKNKHLLNDLENNEISIIINKIYFRLKFLLVHVLRKKLDNNEYLNAFRILIKFLLIFKMKKAVGFVLKEIVNMINKVDENNK